MQHRKAILGAAVSILITLSPAFKAGSFQQEKLKPLQHEVAVTLKLVQVYVTDKKGSPVTDLKLEDFELHDNGILQKITDFEKHVLAGLGEPTEKVVETEVPSARAPVKLGRKFVLLIDYFQNDLQGIKRAKTAAQHFLETQLLPTDEVAVFSFSPLRGLVVHEFLTLNHQKALAAVSSLGRRGGLPFYGLDENKGVPMKYEGDLLESSSDLTNEWSIVNTNKFSLAMKELAMSLRTIPGFKNVIFFSAGIPRSLAFDSAMDQTEGMLYSYGSIAAGGYQDMVREFSASSCPVYSINTEGTRAALKPREERGTVALQQLSELSGGRYFHSGDSYEKVSETIQRITGNYYVLGYYINEKWDGRYHELKIKVKRDGCQVSAQGGYFSAKPFSAYSDFEKQLHLLDLVMNERTQFQSPLPLKIQALQYSFDKGENCLLIGEINFASLAQRKIFQYSFASLKTGRYDCRLVVRNLETGRAAVGSEELTVNQPGQAGLDLFPAVLLLPGKVSAYLRVVENNDNAPDQRPLSIKDIYPLIPADSTLLFEDFEEGVEKLLVVLRCQVPAVPEPSLKIAARLTDAAENVIPVSYSLLTGKKDGTTWIFLLDIRLPKLLSGDYVLTLSATETTTQVVSEAAKLIKIRPVDPKNLLQ